MYESLSEHGSISTTKETFFALLNGAATIKSVDNITAYIALRLVDQGLLSLDEPLDTYLPDPWLPPSEYRDIITLRHVLSHSAGLGHGTTSRHSLFPPGGVRCPE